MAQLDRLSADGATLRVEGSASLDAPDPGSQVVRVVAVRRVRPRMLRRFFAVRLDVEAERRPAGFVATLDCRRLRTLGRWWREADFDIYVTVRTRRRRGRSVTFSLDPVAPQPPLALRPARDVLVTAHVADSGAVAVAVRRRWALVEQCTVADGALVVSGSASLPSEGGLTLVAGGAHRREFATHVEPDGFSARLPIAELQPPADDAAAAWDLSLAGVRPWVAGPPPDPVRGGGETEVTLTQGDAALVLRRAGATVTGARWIEPGVLELTGRRRAGGELVLRARSTLSVHAFAISDGAQPEHFSARLDVAGVDSLAGPLPLPADTYDVVLGSASPGGAVVVAAPLFPELPAESVVDHKPFRIGVAPDGRAVLAVDRDLDADERGDRQQRRLRRRTYKPQRAEPLREAVVYSSFRGRQYSDSPRAIHEELVRRGAPLEHLWVVRDGQCRVPATATAVREGSREHYEALARARFVVCNDHFSEWFVRRDDQVSLQTWHGTPLKRLGFDVSELRDQVRQFQHEWPRRVRNWQYVLSPNRFSTPILQRAYRIEGEMLELGYPRNDMLAGPERDALSRRLRRRLGIPDDVRVVLYAPTYRDHVRDSRRRYRLELKLDLDALRSALGDDTVVLFRKHHYIVDPVPHTPDGLVRDVSSYPDGTELMLAADVLVTDYSSMMFDFANTGRPMLFFVYDIDAYRDEIRGFYFDFADQAPGPLVRTTAELADALRDIDAVGAEFDARYRAFTSRFCELDDGYASARVADRLFSG